MKISFLFSIFIIPIVQAFVPNVYLNGPAGPDMNVFSVPRSIGFKYIQRSQIDAIKKDEHRSICSELDEAREILRDYSRGDLHVSFLTPKGSNDEILYTVVYKMSDRFPKVYTIEALVRGNGKSNVSSLDVVTILDQMIHSRKGFLQLHQLKRWAHGKYLIESNLEKSFTMELD